jgi:O-6-methylguanine DNA methyltransferase
MGVEMEWNRELIEQTLHEMPIRERVPESSNREQARTRIINAMSVELYVVETRLGWMGLAQSSRGIQFLKLPTSSREHVVAALQREFPRGMSKERAPERVQQQLRRYAEGELRFFELEVDLSRVKPFQKSVLTTISRIPFGETRSYSWVANQIGHPKAARAVGHALATNPIPIIIPCHRVLTSGGRLGGYAGGLAMKQALLRLEGAVRE